MCASHYNQWHAGKNLSALPKAAKRMTPLDRFLSYVDKSDGCWEWTGRKIHDYGSFYAAGHHIRAHRFSYKQFVGPIPTGMEIDHMCHNKSCVNPSHLRLATHKQNRENLTGAQKNNTTSGIRGVYWKASRNRWAAMVMHSKKRYHVGHFTDIREAEAAVIAKRNELFTHNDLDRATLREPSDV